MPVITRKDRLFMLEGKNISKNVEGTEILSDLSISVVPSTITCLIGPSGAGKSTVLSCLSLISPPSSGTVLLDAKEFHFGNGNNGFVDFPYPKVTVVFQGLFLWPHLTNRDNILLPLRHSSYRKEDLDDLVNKLGIHSILLKYPNECSGGEQQRVALVRQIMLKPKYLLLDEITSALDLETVNVVADILLELKQAGMGILLATHMINFAKMICDDFYFLDKGALVEYGSIEQLNQPQSRRLNKFLQIYS